MSNHHQCLHPRFKGVEGTGTWKNDWLTDGHIDIYTDRQGVWSGQFEISLKTASQSLMFPFNFLEMKIIQSLAWQSPYLHACLWLVASQPKSDSDSGSGSNGKISTDWNIPKSFLVSKKTLNPKSLDIFHGRCATLFASIPHCMNQFEIYVYRFTLNRILVLLF